MPQQHIERVDSLPLILHWLLKMRIAETVDAIWQAHPNWQGLSYGQLAVLFLAYVLHQRRHCLSGMEDWVRHHRTVLQQVMGWPVGDKDATDDRLGILLQNLGSDSEQHACFQRQLGRHLIHAYALPTQLARYDTSTFSVHHDPAKAAATHQDVLWFGHSKDRRPDLLQFKQGLGTLDPAGVPLVTTTVPGNAADDPLYVPAWREMVRTIGHPHSLFVADCKAAALTTRATIDHEGGAYLFPLPMTGEVPAQLREWVLQPPVEPAPIRLPDVVDEASQPQEVGQGFTIERVLMGATVPGQTHTWTERWLVSRNTAQAHRQQQALHRRLQRAGEELQRLQPKKDESAVDFQARAERILQRRQVLDLITVTVEETMRIQKRYIGPGRPGPNRPYRLVGQRRLQLHYQRQEPAIAAARQLAGWRIYVTNTPAATLSLSQASAHYRAEWRLEQGYHRFKKGSLPALPLFVRVPARIKGLMLLLTVALQALTLLEFVARRSLAEHQDTIAGLVPGNPQMSTAHPTAERLVAAFANLHLLVEETATQRTGRLVETLTPLQRRILALLHVPKAVYDLSFSQPMLEHKFYNSTYT